MNRPDIEAIQARVNPASRGDTFSPDSWRLMSVDIGEPLNLIGVLTENPDPEYWLHPGFNAVGRFEKVEDAAFAAHAHTDIPALLEYIEQLEAHRDAQVAQVYQTGQMPPMLPG